MALSRTILRAGVAVGSLILIGLSVACGASPDESPTSSSSEAVVVTSCAETPFTVLVHHPAVCTGNPPPIGGSSSGANIQSVGQLRPEMACIAAYNSCDPVAAAGWPTPEWGLSCWNAAGAVNVAPVPSALAGRGCTAGVALTGDYFASAGVWACPSSPTGVPLLPLPTTGLGVAPLCDPSTVLVTDVMPALPNGAKGPLCEAILVGPKYDGPGVGDTYSGWTLVEERVFSTTAWDEPFIPDGGNHINHGCSAACAQPIP